MGVPALRRIGMACVAAPALATALASGVAADRLNWAHLPFTNCVGTTATQTGTFPMIRTDLGVTYGNSQGLTFRILFIEQPANGTLTATITDNKITTAGDWTSQPMDTLTSDTMSIELTFQATKQFTDGGRVRLLINGNLESIDVPTIVSCTTASTVDGFAPLLAAATVGPDLTLIVLAVIGLLIGGVAGELVRRARPAVRLGPPVTPLIAGGLVGALIAVSLQVGLAPAGSIATASPAPGASGLTAEASPTAGLLPTPGGSALASADASSSPSAGSSSPSAATSGPTAGQTATPTSGAASSAPTFGPPSSAPTFGPASSALTTPPVTAGPSPGATPNPTVAPPALTAATDLYFPMDVEELAIGQLLLDPLSNDVGPHPEQIEITSVTQLTIPAHYVHSGDTGTAQIGTLSVTSDHKHLTWVDNVCRTVSSLCYNLPPLRFTYQIGDGARTDAGVGWLKFDRPWLIPFDYDRTLLVVPAAVADYIAVDIPLPVLQATTLSINGLPGVKLTLLEPCPSDPTTACLIDVTTPSSGQIAGVLKPVSSTELNSYVTLAEPVDAGSGNYAIYGLADFGTTGLCVSVPFSIPEVGFESVIRSGCWDTSGSIPVSVTGGPRSVPYPPMLQSWGVYIANLSIPVSCATTPKPDACP
jgi:hypothetical protein